MIKVIIGRKGRKMSKVLNALSVQNFIGRIVRPSELRTVRVQGENRQVLNLDLAVNDYFASEEVVSYVQVALWGKQAVAAAKNLNVADQLLVEGARVFPNAYVTKSGEAAYSLEARGGHITWVATPHKGTPVPVCESTPEAAPAAPAIDEAEMAEFRAFMKAKKAAESGPIELDPEPELVYSAEDEPF